MQQFLSRFNGRSGIALAVLLFTAVVIVSLIWSGNAERQSSKISSVQNPPSTSNPGHCSSARGAASAPAFVCELTSSSSKQSGADSSAGTKRNASSASGKNMRKREKFPPVVFAPGSIPGQSTDDISGSAMHTVEEWSGTHKKMVSVPHRLGRAPEQLEPDFPM